MNKTILTLTAAFSFCGALSSEDSVEAWIGRSGNPPNLTKTADGLQTLPGKEFYVFSAKPVPLKKDVRYSVSGSFKRAPGNTERNVPLFFAVAFYDKDGKWIHGMEACPVSGTLTELAAPAKKGDRIIKLKDASKAKKGSAEPNRHKVASVTWDQVRTIAENKMPDLNCFTIASAMKMVAGTARSMGIEVKGDLPAELS